MGTGVIADVLKIRRFNSREDREQTLLRYVALYNHQLPHSALKNKSPMQAVKDWYQSTSTCPTSDSSGCISPEAFERASA